MRSWLDHNSKWLLVFDNAKKPEDIHDYLPRNGGGHVIITSRNPVWNNTATTLAYEGFQRHESIELLFKRTGQDDEGAANALAEALGDLPLALDQAGAYIMATGITLADYLELFQTLRNELWNAEISPSDNRDKVDTIWVLAINLVKNEAPEGVDLLNLCAFLAPKDIPRSLFSESDEQLLGTLVDVLTLNRAINSLRRYSLIEASIEALSVHKLVQTVVRDRLDKAAREKWSEIAVRLVNDAFTFDINDPQTWDESSRLLSHAIVATQHAEELDVASDVTSILLNKVGLCLREKEELIESKSTFEKALEIDIKSYGPNHPSVARDINNLGTVLHDMGDLAGAKKSYERALEIDETVYGPDHPTVAKDVNNLGVILRVLGDLTGAKKSYERAIEIDEKVYGSDHFTVARDINNLGGVLRALDDLAGAKKSYERALEIDEKVYGPNHTTVARDVNNLGMVLHDIGDLDGAKKCYERALLIFRNFLGEDHPHTAIVAENLHNLIEGSI